MLRAGSLSGGVDPIFLARARVALRKSANRIEGQPVLWLPADVCVAPAGLPAENDAQKADRMFSFLALPPPLLNGTS